MDVEELFRFETHDELDCCLIAEYLQNKNPVVTDIEIPALYNNKEIKGIKDRAFFESKHLRSIILSDSIGWIGIGAFAKCVSLENIKLPDSVFEIRGSAFWQCSALKTIILPKGLREISYSAFKDCSDLEKVVFTGSGSVRIEEGAFENCSKLPPEFQIYSLVGYKNINIPFRKDPFGDFDWDLALEENVFKAAIKHNNFSVLKKDLFKHIVDLNSIDYLVQAEHLFDEHLITKILNYSIECGKTELTAYFLELKKRKFGFKKDGDLDL